MCSYDTDTALLVHMGSKLTSAQVQWQSPIMPMLTIIMLEVQPRQPDIAPVWGGCGLGADIVTYVD